jgi:hypothetical protein
MNSMKSLMLFAMLFFALPASAEKIDCESLVGVGSGLDDVRTGLSDGEEVDEETYSTLGDLIDTLRVIADEEGNTKLDAALDRLQSAYENNDRPGFVKALQDVDTLFGAFYTADCGE